jgi:hypothetical protein
MRRSMLLPVLVGAFLLASAAIAVAAKPVAGEWNGTKSLNFTVNAAGTKISEFRPGGCAAGPLGWTLKVAPNGSFSLKKKISLEGGKPVAMKIKGKFATPTTASGSISYGKCKQKFKATGKAPRVEQPPEQPPTDDVDLG